MSEINLKRFQAVTFAAALIAVNIMRLQLSVPLSKLYQLNGDVAAIGSEFVHTFDRLRLVSVAFAITFLLLAIFKLKGRSNRVYYICECVLWICALAVSIIVT